MRLWRVKQTGLSLILLWFFAGNAVAQSAESGYSRVVSLSPAVTEIIFALGRGERLVGRSTVCNYPDRARKVRAVGDFGRPNAEAVLAVKPDLILTNAWGDQTAEALFRQAGIRTECRQCRTLEDYRIWVRQLGRWLDAVPAAERLLAESEDREKKCLRNLSSESARPSAIWIVWNEPLMIAGKGSLPNTILKLSGVRNPAAEMPEYWSGSLEWLLAADPDFLVCPELTESRYRELRRNPIWSQFRAVRENRVLFRFDADRLQRPGPRIFDGIEELQKAFRYRCGN